MELPAAITYLPRDADQVLILGNRQAGRGRARQAIEQLTGQLHRLGLAVRACDDPSEWETTWERTDRTSLRTVVAAGGDGTVSHLVNFLPPDVPLAILPLGTENLMAKYLGHNGSAEELAHLIRHGATVRVDAGVANGQLFLLMAGIGFDADVVRRLHDTRRGPIRHTTYIKPIVQSIRRYSYPELTIEVIAAAAAGRPECGRATPDCSPATVPEATKTRKWHACWAFAVNIPRYAMGLGFAPAADPADGLLDLVVFDHGHLHHGLRYLAAVIAGTHGELPDCHRVQVERVRIDACQPVPYQLDGDPGGWLPLDLEVRRQRIRAVVSERWAVGRGWQHQSSGAAHGAHGPG